jgi:hypothetical protein
MCVLARVVFPVPGGPSMGTYPYPNAAASAMKPMAATVEASGELMISTTSSHPLSMWPNHSVNPLLFRFNRDQMVRHSSSRAARAPTGKCLRVFTAHKAAS